MPTVKVSSKYQIVIPREIRQKLKLRPGLLLRAVEYDGRLELIPVREPSALRGAFPGLSTEILRDEDRC